MVHIVSVAEIGALVGDPARANMLEALMDRRALTAKELAARAGIAPQTASGHLAKLIAGGLITMSFAIVADVVSYPAGPTSTIGWA